MSLLFQIPCCFHIVFSHDVAVIGSKVVVVATCWLVVVIRMRRFASLVVLEEKGKRCFVVSDA